jgi:hypothetical protein
MKEVTYEQALEAANKIREYRKNCTNLYGEEWVSITSDLDRILLHWRRPDLSDKSKNRDDFKEEYEYIHRVAISNWRNYEDNVVW